MSLVDLFTPEQVAKLKDKLSLDRVKSRKQGGTTVDYVEGYSVIEAANDIFGFGNWEGKIISLMVEVREQTSDGWYVGYLCRYQITIWNAAHTTNVMFDDVGWGNGSVKNKTPSGLGSAIESATKEAVTDAMKRAWRNFGNQFGLALYDKEQRNVEQEEQPKAQSKQTQEQPKAQTQEQPFNRDEAVEKIKALKKFDPEIHAPLLIKAMTRDDLLGLFHSINNS